MRWTIAIWAVSLAALAGLAVAAYDVLKRPGDILNESVEFDESEDRPRKPKPEKDETVDCPRSGPSGNGTRVSSTSSPRSSSTTSSTA
jgi:hypothetical protein